MTRGARAWVFMATLLAACALLGWPVSHERIDWQPTLALGQPWLAFTAVGVHYSVQHLIGNRLGLLYNRKAPIEGSAEENVVQALGAALEACRRLEREPEFAGRLQFGTAQELEITVNDRALAPNTDEAFASLKPAIERALAATYGGVEFDLERLGDARERLRIAVRAHGGE